MTFPRSPLRMALWGLAALSALFALALIIVTLALPGWAAGRGVALASEALGRPVSIGRAHVQPWRLAIVVEQLRIAGATPAAPPLLTLERLDAALSLRSLLRGHVVVESMALVQPELRLARLAEGRYDIDDLIRRFAAQPGAADDGEPEFAVYNIELSEGRILFDDRPVHRQHELAGLRLALPFLSTIAADVSVKVQPHLSGQLDGVAFDSRAEALPFAEDASARLSLKLAGLDLAPLAAYLPADLPLRLQGGRLDLDLAADFAERPRQLPGVKLSGRVRLNELALTRPDGQPLLALKQADLPLADVQPLRRHVVLGQVLLDAPTIHVGPLPQARRGGPAAPPWQVGLAGLEVREGRVEFRQLALDSVELKLGAAAWPLKQPLTLDARLRLDQARLSARARLAPEALQADVELDDLAVGRLAAWLPLPANAALAVQVSTRAALTVERPLDGGAVDRARLALRDLQMDDLRLSLAGKPLLAMAHGRLDRADIDAATRTLQLGQLRLDAPLVQLERDAAGRLNLEALRPAAEAEPSARGPSWKLQLAGLAIERGGLRWRDAAVALGLAPVALAVEPLRLQLASLAWPAVGPVQVQLGATVAALGVNNQPVVPSGGSLQWSGSVGLAPWAASGSLQARGLPLHLLGAYVNPAWGLHLQRAELGLKAQVGATQQPGGGWQASAEGDVRLGPLALLQTRMVDGQRVVGEDLLSWQSLQLVGAKLALAPGAAPKLAVQDAQLDDAYARLIINEQGRFNLRDIRPAEAASAPAAAAAPLEFAAERIRLNRGLVDFSDRFVRPNYSARLTELQGSLGAFSSTGTQMAPLTLRGRIAGTGQLDVEGRLKPGTPLAMDLLANASDIELAPLSGYAGRYAGYAIERGKLSARMRYQVEPGGQLVASNQLILNQLTFGDRVDSPDATSLPVRLAAALLKDRHGVIDIQLPVSGSLNDPEFSVGGVLWKLLLNLIGKALTSPFSLFSGSDAPEAAQVRFAPGSAELTGSDQLDRIARLLLDKPDVQLTLTGWADPVMEGVALRAQRLDGALKAQNAPTPEAALQQLYQASPLPNKPRNMVGLPKELPAEQMRGLLMGSYIVDGDTLRQLAVTRAIAVRDALLARGVPNTRMYLAAPKLCDGACEDGWQPHVEMSLGSL
jgi:uncharacterized protein involved in outer membrane biogenesis